MIWRRSPLLPFLLLVGNVLLVLAIFWVWWGEGENRLAPQRQPKVTVPKVPGVRPPQNISEFRVIATKDLFSPDREGPAPDLATDQGQGNLEGSSLMGVIIVGAKKAAIIGSQPGPARRGQPGALSQAEVVYLGERWNGLTVVNITPEAVVFQGRDGQRTLKFPE